MFIAHVAGCSISNKLPACSMQIALKMTLLNSALCLTLSCEPCGAPAQLTIMPGRKRRKPGEQAAVFIGNLSAITCQFAQPCAEAMVSPCSTSRGGF